jgi:hypothetical protein
MMKKILIALLSIPILILLFIGGYRGLTKHIYNRTDCEAFNIDNIELRTGIDVPAVIESDCECFVTGNTKTAKFILDTENLDFERYVSRNKFEWLEGEYRNSGETDDTAWASTLNQETKELTVFIEYKL